MVNLFETGKLGEGRPSSKGNQLKWSRDGWWYKTDYTGYEGLAEYVVSGLLHGSSLAKEEFISYHTEKICYRNTAFRGCVSANFLPEKWKMLTLERLFQNCYGESFTRQIYRIEGVAKRLRFLVEQTVRMTGLSDFGVYMSKLLTIDAFFLNEDRHMHNVAVLMDDAGAFHYCPFFDHGAALLADTTLDYPMSMDVIDAMELAKAKTLCPDFDAQLDAAEALYDQHIRFGFTEKKLDSILDAEPYNPEEMKERIKTIVLQQKRKYRYLF